MAKTDQQNEIADAIEKIKSLIVQEKWNNAHRGCLEILRFDPENITVIRLKNKIEKKVQDLNKKAIKDDLKKLKALWEDKKYEELVHNLKRLEPYMEQYAPLKKFIIKAQKEYKKIVIGEKENEYNEGIKEIKKLTKKNQYADALRLCIKITKLEVYKAAHKAFTKKLIADWVDYELKTNSALLKSNKYEDIILLYNRLLRIDPKSLKVKVRLKKAKKDYDLYRIDQKRDIIYKELEKLRTLMQMRKYDNAYEISQALLNVDPRNKEAKVIFLKSKRKVEKMVDKTLIKQMKYSSKTIKEEYKKNKKDYIKI